MTILLSLGEVLTNPKGAVCRVLSSEPVNARALEPPRDTGSCSALGQESSSGSSVVLLCRLPLQEPVLGLVLHTQVPGMLPALLVRGSLGVKPLESVHSTVLHRAVCPAHQTEACALLWEEAEHCSQWWKGNGFTALHFLLLKQWNWDFKGGQDFSSHCFSFLHVCSCAFAPAPIWLLPQGCKERAEESVPCVQSNLETQHQPFLKVLGTWMQVKLGKKKGILQTQDFMKVLVVPGQGELHLFFFFLCDVYRAPQVGGDLKPSSNPTFCGKESLGGTSSAQLCLENFSDGDSLNCSNWKNFPSFIKTKNFPCASGACDLQNN